MANIVFCADGTWNGPGQQDSASQKSDNASNVLKLYLCLAGDDSTEAATYRSADEQERILLAGAGQKLQHAKYLHGVGDSDNFLVKVLGGALGAGVIARIVRGYTFISRCYNPGDRIYVVGFSRGAYTARALAGLISAKGLLDGQAHDLSDKQGAYRLGARAWADYRGDVSRRVNANWVQQMEGLLADLPRFFSDGVDPKFVLNVVVEAVGVWDTVGSYGIPQYQVDLNRLDMFQFADLVLSKQIKHGYHAISIDEMRADFTPTLWVPDPSRVEQMLFPGAHADVGGGYPDGESGLAAGALLWMIERLRTAGVMFSNTMKVTPTPDALASAHSPWLHTPWNILPRGARATLQGLPKHPSVAQRLGQAVCADPGTPPTAYAPANI
jgi:uncharacterized protein (DUF2235 family)